MILTSFNQLNISCASSYTHVLSKFKTNIKTFMILIGVKHAILLQKHLSAKCALCSGTRNNTHWLKQHDLLYIDP